MRGSGRTDCCSLATRGMRMNEDKQHKPDKQETQDGTAKKKTLSVAMWTTSVSGIVESVEAEDAEMHRTRTMSDGSSKRRAGESPEREDVVQVKRGSQEGLFKTRRGLHEMGQLINEASQFIAENRNVHRIIKDIIKKAKKVCNGAKLASEEEEKKRRLEARESERENKTLSERVQSLEEQMEALVTGRLKIAEDRVAELSAENQQLKNRGAWAGPLRSSDKLRTLDGIDNLQEWKEVERKTWEEQVFSNTKITIGNPVTSNLAVKVVLTEPEDPEMENSIQRIYRDRFPELTEGTGDFEILEQISRIRSKRDRELAKRTVIKITQDGSDEDLWGKLSRLRDETTGVEAVAMHHIK
jgi:hypothetical protein